MAGGGLAGSHGNCACPQRLTAGLGNLLCAVHIGWGGRRLLVSATAAAQGIRVHIVHRTVGRSIEREPEEGAGTHRRISIIRRHCTSQSTSYSVSNCWYSQTYYSTVGSYQATHLSGGDQWTRCRSFPCPASQRRRGSREEARCHLLVEPNPRSGRMDELWAHRHRPPPSPGAAQDRAWATALAEIVPVVRHVISQWIQPYNRVWWPTLTKGESSFGKMRSAFMMLSNMASRLRL